MNHPLISVILPVYNVERYIHKCVDSILAQSYKNLEIILVDDGSTDNSGKICDEYALKDSRIKIIHKLNGGVCSARNQGLDIAKGDFIAFVDPDDYLLTDMYYNLIAIIQMEKADIVVCKQQDIGENGTSVNVKFPSNTNFVYKEYYDWFKDLIEYDSLDVLWNKLFNRRILEKHRFDTDLVRAEDLNFLLDVTKDNYNIVLYPHVFYCYIKHKNSAVRQYKIKNFDCEYIVWKKILKINNDFKDNDKLNVTSNNILKKIIERAYKLSLLIILLDGDKQYELRLEELKQFFKIHFSQRKLLSKRILKIWTFIFAKYPNFVIKILRLPILRHLSLFYITHR